MSDRDASNSPRDQLTPEMLLYGFMRAVGRFTRSGLSGENLTEPDQDDDLDRQVLAVEWSNAVFEALNWSVTLDERIRHSSKRQDWTVGIEGGGVIRALRYARNSVHHDWSAALDIGLAPDELLVPHARSSALLGSTSWPLDAPTGKAPQLTPTRSLDGTSVRPFLLQERSARKASRRCGPRTHRLEK